MLEERIIIDLPYSKLEDAILTALEKDTGVIPIVPEIIRICKIKMRKEKKHDQKISNLKQFQPKSCKLASELYKSRAIYQMFQND